MKKYLVLFLLLLVPWTMLFAQNSKRVNDLKKQQSKLKSELKNSRTKLDNTRKQVQTGQRNIDFLGLQISNRLAHIQELEHELDSMEANITTLQANIAELDGEVRVRRQRLKAAVRNARALRVKNDPAVFVLSANTFGQMYRRARYAREYVAYQQNLGQQLLQKQAELLDAQNQLLAAKSQKDALLNEVIRQRKALSEQQLQEQNRVAGLKKQESGLKAQVEEQQRQIAALDKKIEEVIAYEIEQARKKAAEEARKKAAAEAERKKKEAESKKKSSGGGSKQKQNTKPSTPQKSDTWLTAEDRQINGSFEQNKGRLPVPITGQYMLGSRFGIYNVPGLANVQLDNKGTNYIGRPGARARAIFDGEVTSVFEYAGKRHVLVRHGSYISVYSNLSSTIVTKGQKVHTNDILGTVADDGSGNCTLHFQLRKDTGKREPAKLNPEAWIGR